MSAITTKDGKHYEDWGEDSVATLDWALPTIEGPA